jgi:glutamate/tyrosine decarboxylase-like PLP-dependent enzyme
MQNEKKKYTAYVSQETHTWIQKAADLFGHGVDAIRWIPTDTDLRMDINHLAGKIKQDREMGFEPFLVVGTAGTVSTGAVDPLEDIGELCRSEHLWFHVDGAYGAPAVVAAQAPKDLSAMTNADSVALDPHKWLYAPLEAGCVLVRDPQWLVDTFSFKPEYYRFEGSDGETRTNFFEHGMQNSRGFRALKVWVQLKQAGRRGLTEAIEGDIMLAQRMSTSLQKN